MSEAADGPKSATGSVQVNLSAFPDRQVAIIAILSTPSRMTSTLIDIKLEPESKNTGKIEHTHDGTSRSKARFCLLIEPVDVGSEYHTEFKIRKHAGVETEITQSVNRN